MLDLSGVVVRSRFPLDIIAERSLNIDVAKDILEQRVQQAAQFGGFGIAKSYEQRWTLQRGSLWHASYSCDVRKLPTTVIIEMASPNQLHILLHCQSPLSISTPGDKKRFSHELDDLETQLVHGG